LRQVKLQIAMFDRPMIAFANITEEKNASGRSDGIVRLDTHRGITWSADGEPDCIPNAQRRRPAATAGVAQVAERFQHVLRRKFADMTRSHAVPAPSAPQRKPRRMRPGAIFKSRHRHEVRTGQYLLAVRNLLGLATIGSGNCNQSNNIWRVLGGRSMRCGARM
jgi:hypothetical protein